MAQSIFTWLDERLGLTEIYDTILDRKVPKVNWWFTLGSASLFLGLLQGITGMLLSVYYVHYDRCPVRMAYSRCAPLGSIFVDPIRIYSHAAGILLRCL